MDYSFLLINLFIIWGNSFSPFNWFVSNNFVGYSNLLNYLVGPFATNPGDFTKKNKTKHYLKVFMVYLKQIYETTRLLINNIQPFLHDSRSSL